MHARNLQKKKSKIRMTKIDTELPATERSYVTEEKGRSNAMFS